MIRNPRTHGFTAIELMIGLTILVPILFAVLSTGTVVTRSMAVNEGAAAVWADTVQIKNRILQFLRPASLGSMQIYDGMAWVLPAEATPYQTLRYRTLDAMPVTGQPYLKRGRELSFQLDRGETADGKDNDGDGLVDEGRIFLAFSDSPASRSVLGSHIEQFSMMRKGRRFFISLQRARRDRNGTMHRATLQTSFYLRNN